MINNRPEKLTSNLNKALYPLLAVNFVGTLGLGIVLPFLIYLVTAFGGNAVIYGIFGATYSAFQMIGAPILGKWSDQYGRRRILLVSHLGTLVSWLIFFLACLHVRFTPFSSLALMVAPGRRGNRRGIHRWRICNDYQSIH